MNVEEIKNEILSKIKFESYPQTILGGQSVCLLSRGVTLISDDMDFKVSIGIGKSNLKNKDLALTLFELYLDEVIK